MNNYFKNVFFDIERRFFGDLGSLNVQKDSFYMRMVGSSREGFFFNQYYFVGFIFVGKEVVLDIFVFYLLCYVWLKILENCVCNYYLEVSLICFEGDFLVGVRKGRECCLG